MEQSFPTVEVWTKDLPQHLFHVNQLAGWPGFGDSLEIVLNDLERWSPKGLDSRRTTFRTQANNESKLLDLRSELVIAASLARNRVTFEFRKDSPDLLCQTTGGPVGIEVTTRQRHDIRRLHNTLEERLTKVSGARVKLTRIGKEYKFDQTRIEEIVGPVVWAAKNGEDSTLSFPWAGVSVNIWHDSESEANSQVFWNSAQDWDIHWAGVAIELANSVRSKGEKVYAVPTIAVVDITRLFDSSHWPGGDIPKVLTSHLNAGIAESLEGVVIVQSGFLQSAAVVILESWANPAKTEGRDLANWFNSATQLSIPLKLQQLIREQINDLEEGSNGQDS